jgi:1-deoxyxylulose-5-phosphate synthase
MGFPLMEYVKLGNTGLDVSLLCLGCMSFGVTNTNSGPAEWF